MGSTPSPPPAPNPAATAAAQSAANKDTAIAQARLNATNQVTPYGNLNYTASAPDATGVPQYTATETLSPDQQNLFNLNQQSQTNLGKIGVDQTQKVGDLLNTPFDLNSATSTQQADISKSLLDPVWQQRQQQQQQQLANQGIQVGSEAYTNAMRDFGMQRDNSYNSALLADRGQATQEALTQRNQPLNEISALMSGSQVQQPSFVNTPNTGVAPTDVIGAYGQAQQANQFNYNQQMQNRNAMMGGMFGLGSAALGGWALSEPDLKTDKTKVGETKDGMGLYAFRYKGEPKSHPKRVGLMADQVQKKHPSAVARPVKGGPRMVNYSQVAKALSNG